MLSYNGELYNYRDLRHRLKEQWTFRTQGDVEVVLAGLVRYGPDFLTLMEGMWALALWDDQSQDLLLVRDRMGQKPLYYQTDCRRMACASELGALSALSWHPWQEDFRSTADYLRYGYYLPGTTAYKGVREVLPGHWLRWKAGRAPTLQAYWRISPGGLSVSRNKACEALRETIIQGVKRRLVADVEVGALLSGGIDSSLVVSIVRSELHKPIKTFCMGFQDDSFDERVYARRMAQQCSSDHYEGYLDLASQAGLVDRLLHQVGQPFGDASLLPPALVSSLAAGRVKVALSGDGGDELFSGYQRYLGRCLLRWYTRLPEQLRRTAARVLARWDEPGAHHSASLLKKAHLFMDAAQRVDDETPYIAPLAYSASNFRNLLPDLHRLGHPPPRLPRA
ncbi:MAG: asparagine synthase-related protein, partial [Desulfosarcinaceae bacterium]